MFGVAQARVCVCVCMCACLRACKRGRFRWSTACVCVVPLPHGRITELRVKGCQIEVLLEERSNFACARARVCACVQLGHGVCYVRACPWWQADFKQNSVRDV